MASFAQGGTVDRIQSDSSSGPLTLVAGSPYLTLVAPAADNYVVNLPDATTVVVGRSYRISNSSLAYKLKIKDSSGALVQYVPPGCDLVCESTSSATVSGVWVFSTPADSRSPLKLTQSVVPDANLNILSNQLIQSDGATLSTPVLNNTFSTFPQTKVNFQTGAVVGGTVTVNASAFAIPASVLGQYRRVCFSYVSTLNTVDTNWSAEAVSVAALDSPATLFGALSGTPIGYLDLQATVTSATGAYKSADALTSIIANEVSGSPTITRFSATGGGGGSGTGNPILETIKNEGVDSPYGFAAANIIAVDGLANVATLVGAALNLTTNTIQFSANSQSLVSTNQFDAANFLTRGQDCWSVDLTAFWNKGSTTQALSIPTAFTYQVSRDGGTNYYPMTMTRVGATEVFRGNVTFTPEAIQNSLVTQTGAGPSFRTLAASGTDVSLSQSFTVPASQTWVVTQAILNLTKTGTPGGNLYLSVVKDAAGVPSTVLSDLVAQSNANLASGLVTGANTVVLPTTPLVSGVYHLVLSTDAAYQGTGSFVSNHLAVQESAAATGESSYNGTIWSAQSRGVLYTLQGRNMDLRVQIASAGSPVYPCGLDGWGVFYGLKGQGLVSSFKKSQRFVFNSTTDNLSSFQISAFSPDPDLLSIYHIETGQVYKCPSFSLYGTTAQFPTNTFNNSGESTTVTLIADQNGGCAVDTNDSNARLLAASHLGSSSGADDKSTAGRGPLLRDLSGVLREFALDSSGNISVLTAPGGLVLKTIGAVGQSYLRYNTSSGYGSTNTCIVRYTGLVAALGSDITYADSATLGTTWTINTSGVYSITASFAASVAIKVGLSLNSAQLSTSVATITASTRLVLAATIGNDGFVPFTVTQPFSAGDIIRVHGDGAGSATATPSLAVFTITRMS